MLTPPVRSRSQGNPQRKDGAKSLTKVTKLIGEDVPDGATRPTKPHPAPQASLVESASGTAIGERTAASKAHAAPEAEGAGVDA